MAAKDQVTNIKSNTKILVMGNNGIGKSRLINKFLGKDEAKVGDTVQPTNHDVIEEIHHSSTAHDASITIYDMRGFGDPENPNRSIIESVISKIKDADIIFICHRLYQRVDKHIQKIMEDLAWGVGNALMKHAIFVFTYGDEYVIHCDTNDVATESMKAQEEKVKDVIKSTLLKKNIKKEIVDSIPSIITSGKYTNLPTCDNWVEELWALCEKHCAPEAVKFVSWWRRNVNLVVGGTVGAIAVGAAGSITGGNVTTGAMTGVTVGGIGGGVVGAMAGVKMMQDN